MERYTHAGLHLYIRGGLSSWGLWWNKTQQKDKKTAYLFYALSIFGLKNFHDKKYSHISWPCLVAYLGPMDTGHFQSHLEHWNRCTLNQGWVVVGVQPPMTFECRCSFLSVINRKDRTSAFIGSHPGASCLHLMWFAPTVDLGIK